MVAIDPVCEMTVDGKSAKFKTFYSKNLLLLQHLLQDIGKVPGLWVGLIILLIISWPFASVL